MSVSPRCFFFLAAIVVAASLSGAGCHSTTNEAAAVASKKTETRTAAASAEPSPAAHSSSSSDGGIRFAEAGREAGLDYRWTVRGTRPLNILQTIGNGCAFLDYDNDGSFDILLVGEPSALYRGDGRGHFTDVSQKTGIAALTGHFLGCAVGDFNNDGFDDVYLSAYRGGVLLKNEQGKRFADITRSAGLRPQPWGTSCAFADVNNDGLLDLYVANYVDFGPDTQPQLCEMKERGKEGTVLSSCGPRFYRATHKGVLYRNQQGKRFADVTQEWGADAHTGKGLGAAFAPFDETGRLGLAVANDEVAGDLFQNDGNGKLTNIGAESGTAFDRNGTAHGGMGVDWGDFDNDGLLDLFVGTFHNETKSLYRNEGDRIFTDVSAEAGTGGPILPYVTFGAKFLDADNDGHLDLLLANGHVQDNIAAIEEADYRQKTILLRNTGAASFTDISASSGLDALPPIVGRGLAVGDYDNDGKTDALIVDSEGRPLLLHNVSETKNRWVGFALTDDRPGNNRDAFGAIVRVTTSGSGGSGKAFMRLCHTDGSYLSASDSRVLVGLGAGSAAVTVSVRWPDGKQERWENVPTNRYLRLRPGRPPE